MDREADRRASGGLPPGAGRAACAGVRHRAGDGDAARQQCSARADEPVHPLRQFAARRAGAGRVRPRAGADARPLHLSIEDVRHVAPAVLRHRIILNFDAHADGQNTETILRKILSGVTARDLRNPAST